MKTFLGFVFLLIGLSGVALAGGKKQTTEVETSGASTSLIWVAKPDGALGCQPGSGEDLKIGEKMLRDAGVQVIERRKGTDGKMRAAVCGIATGALNVYQIRSEDLERARILGFSQVQK